MANLEPLVNLATVGSTQQRGGNPIITSLSTIHFHRLYFEKRDQEVLERIFRQQVNSGQLSRVWDRDTIGFWVRRQQFSSRHLRDLIQESDFRRYEAVTDAVFEVYTSIDWGQEIDATSGNRRIGQRRMTAELYRVEDAIMGDLKYHLYPRQPKQFGGGTLELVHNGTVYPLQEERQGWFMPLWPVDPAGGMFYEVGGHPQIKELVLPEGKFLDSYS